MAEELDDRARIVIYGAGSIGCFVGGLLRLAGRRVTFLARPRIAAELAVHGLRISDYTGLQERIGPEALDVQTSPGCLAGAGLVLLTVKSRNTEVAAGDIAGLTAPGVPMVSLQNGVDNAAILRARLGPERVLGGMVAFNIVHKGHGAFHRGTEGAIVIEAGRPDIVHLVSVPGLAVSPTANIAGVQWGKLLLNLNNGLNALSGLPLRRQLQDRAWRRLLADQIDEARTVLAAAGIVPVPANNVPPRLIPPVLRLPNALFGIVARSMLKIDPQARSSTWDDLSLRRPTEIDHFQGAIVRLAREHGIKAPLSAAVSRLIKEAEAAGAGPPGLSPADIAKSLAEPASPAGRGDVRGNRPH